MLFQLSPLSKEVREKYYQEMVTGLKHRIQNGIKVTKKGKKGNPSSTRTYKLPAKIIKALIPNTGTTHEDLSNLKILLIGLPEVSKKLNDDLIRKFSIKKGKERAVLNKLERIFYYEGEISRNKTRSYWLAKLIQRNTCTYCNRQYVFTVERQGLTVGNKDRYVTRPEFDHWFTKKNYPLLSLNIHNLIPSCKVCNSSVKGTVDGDLNKYVHPYIEDNTPFTFEAFPALAKDNSEDLKWKLRIVRPNGSKMDNTITDFATEELYSMHADLEVKDLMDFAQAYPESFLQNLIEDKDGKRKYPITKRDAFRMFFGIEYDDDRNLDRPFSKLKKDILRQIGVK